MGKIKFLMGLHCHQPVDNFKHIFEDAFKKSYEPFLRVLQRHPRIKLSLHYSGSLLEWITSERPYFLDMLKKLIDCGQIELLTGGYFEPVLPMVPARDARGQIEMFTNVLEKHFGKRPKGMWLSERVWDPSLSELFKASDIEYTILDDFHLKKAGLKGDSVFGHYKVNGANDFSVFPAIKKLRYTMPFKEPNVTIDYLKSILKEKGEAVVTFADDCEKFGFWPHTYNWVYKKGWLDKFFKKIEEADWIETLTFREAQQTTKSSGTVDIPHSSYSEMAGWSNGNFGNFFKKYPESDFMKNRMLSVSDKLKNIEEKNANVVSKSSITSATRELYKSQSNCAYWHGIFGGVYLPHLRQGVYSHIIKAEDALENGNSQEKVEKVKFSKNIISARNKLLNVFIDPDCAGSIFEIDQRSLSYNLVNTMSRCYEPYHEKLNSKKSMNPKGFKIADGQEESIDLYEVLGVRGKNLNLFLNYDQYRKTSLICHAMSPKTTLDNFVKSTHVDLPKESLLGRYSSEIKDTGKTKSIFLEKRGTVRIDRKSYLMRASKTITLENDGNIVINLDVENLSNDTINFIFGIEFNWSVVNKVFLRKVRKNNVRRIAFGDKFSKLKIEHTFKMPMNLWTFPVYTLNESEKGLGKNFQEISLLFHKKLLLKPKNKFSLKGKIRISK